MQLHTPSPAVPSTRVFFSATALLVAPSRTARSRHTALRQREKGCGSFLGDVPSWKERATVPLGLQQWGTRDEEDCSTVQGDSVTPRNHFQPAHSRHECLLNYAPCHHPPLIRIHQADRRASGTQTRSEMDAWSHASPLHQPAREIKAGSLLAKRSVNKILVSLAEWRKNPRPQGRADTRWGGHKLPAASRTVAALQSNGSSQAPAQKKGGF